MIPNVPYKKMENVNKFSFGFLAKCECGHIHKFKSSEINLKTSSGHSIEFNNIYECPKCGEKHDGIFENKSNKKYNLIGLLITFMLIVGIGYGGYYLLNSLFTPSQPVDYNHATNKQISDFNNWQQKQEQQKWENSPAFPNNK